MGGGGGSEHRKTTKKLINRSFSCDVITFKNQKLKSHQSFYPHRATVQLYSITIYQLNGIFVGA